MVTTKDFSNYLTSLSLFSCEIGEDEGGMYAIVFSLPDLNRFTQMTRIRDGVFRVRLSKKDYYNKEITKGFFKEVEE